MRETEGPQAGETEHGGLDHDAVEGEVNEHSGVKVEGTKDVEVFAAVQEGEGGESGERDILKDFAENDAHGRTGCMEGEGGDAGDE